MLEQNNLIPKSLLLKEKGLLLPSLIGEGPGVRYVFLILIIQINILTTQIQAQTFTLSQIIDSVEKKYPEILKYESQVKALIAKSEGANAWMPPVFSAGLNRFPYQGEVLKERAPMNQAAYMFSLEQMIPNYSRLKAKKNYIESLAEIEKNNEIWTKNILRKETKILYYQRVIAEHKLNTVKQNKELISLLIESSESKYKVNQADLGVIYKAKAKYADMENMELMLLGFIAESNYGINTLLYRNASFSINIDTSLSTLLINNYILPDSLQRNDIEAAFNTINSMKLNRDYMYSLRNPDFGIRFEHMNMFGMSNQYSVMGMVTIPIAPWSAKMYKSEVKAMNYEIDAMFRELQTMELMANRMTIEKLTMLNYEKQQLKNYETAIIPAYNQNFETNMLGFKQNTGSFFVLLDSWEMLLMKKLEYYNKLLNVLRLQAEYEYEIEQ